MTYFAGFIFLGIATYFELANKLSRKREIILGLFCFIFCILMSSIRTGYLADYNLYKEAFDSIDLNVPFYVSIFLPNVISGELGYNFFSYLVKSICANFQFFILVEAVLVNSLVFLFSKNVIGKMCNKNYTIFCLFLFYSLGMMNIYIVRQTIAVCICLNSVYFIFNRKIFPFILCTVLATLFHRTSIIWGVAYFASYIPSDNKNVRYLYVILCLVLGIAIGLIIPMMAKYIPGAFGDKLVDYLAKNKLTYGNPVSLTVQIAKSSLNVVFILCMYLFYFDKYTSNKKFVICFNIFAISVLIFVCSLLTSHQIYRSANSFAMLSIVLFILMFSEKKYVLHKVTCDVRFLFPLFSAYLFLRLFMFLGKNAFFGGFPTIFGILL